MRKFDVYWMSKLEWFHDDPTVGGFQAVINEDAPLEAQESYKHYLEQRKRSIEQIAKGESMD